MIVLYLVLAFLCGGFTAWKTLGILIRLGLAREPFKRSVQNLSYDALSRALQIVTDEIERRRPPA